MRIEQQQCKARSDIRRGIINSNVKRKTNKNNAKQGTTQSE
jgi:hypothetical protein